MGISINTNVAASRSSMYLATNHANLQKSLDRLSSGKRITEPADDAGGLAVSMKLEHNGKILKGASNNISNGISLLQVQDGVLKSVGDIVSRMGELKSMRRMLQKVTLIKQTTTLSLTIYKDNSINCHSLSLMELALFSTAWTQRMELHQLQLTALKEILLVQTIHVRNDGLFLQVVAQD